MAEHGYKLCLYVCGSTPPSEKAVQLLSQFVQKNQAIISGFDLIDVLDRPDIAEREHIIATPTLVKEEPLPREIFIGDLIDADSLQKFLHLNSESDR